MTERASLRILHITAPGAYGGLERVVRSLARGHSAAGHEVTVAAVVNPGEAANHPFLRELTAAGVRVAPLGVPSRAYVRERRLVAELCRSLRPDVVHTHGYRPDVLDAPVVRRLGMPVVTTVHGYTGGGWKNRFFESLDRRALRRCDAVIAVSRALVGQLLASGVPRERLEHVPNAWSPGDPPALERTAARAALAIANGLFTIGWVGRLTREKGADVLLESLAHVRHEPWYAVVFGDGPERAGLEQDVARLGLSGKVQWRGAVPGAHQFYAAFDVFVLSSRTEGIPIVLLEAIAAGVPVVATAVGGVPEVVSEKEGRLVPSEQASALGAAIDDVAGDPRAAEARARAAQAVLRARFDEGQWLARYEAIYRRVATPRAAL